MFWNAVIKTINVTMVFGVPPIVTFAVLVPYELTNERGRTSPYITPQTAFTMLSLFNVLRFPLVVLPKALRCVSEAINAIGVRRPPGCLARGALRAFLHAFLAPCCISLPARLLTPPLLPPRARRTWRGSWPSPPPPSTTCRARWACTSPRPCSSTTPTAPSA